MACRVRGDVTETRRVVSWRRRGHPRAAAPRGGGKPPAAAYRYPAIGSGARTGAASRTNVPVKVLPVVPVSSTVW